MLDEDSWTVLESEKECEQKRMRQDNLKGGGPPGGKPKVPMKPNLGGTPVWSGGANLGLHV